MEIKKGLISPGRKAQFYIFTAIILIAYSTLLLQSLNSMPETSGTFKQVYDNFIFEKNSAINNALFARRDVATEYDRFLTSFISYSRMKKLDLEIFSVLCFGDRVYFNNKMRSPVKVLNINETVPPGTDTDFMRVNLSEVVLELKDDVFHENIYKLNLSVKGTDSKAILRVEKGSKKEIFVVE